MSLHSKSLWIAGFVALSMHVGTVSCFGQTSADPHSAAVLLPVGKALLATALERERTKLDSFISRPPSFPMPMCAFAGGLCGAINRDGTVAVSPAYDWVDNFQEDRALVRLGGLYGYVDTNGRLIAEPKYAEAARFSRGFAQVDVGGQSALIDREGRTVLEPRFGFIVPFTDDLFWVTEDRSVSDGKLGTARFIFDDPMLIFSENRPGQSIRPKGKWGLVDRSGDWVRQPEFWASVFSIAKILGRCGLERMLGGA